MKQSFATILMELHLWFEWEELHCKPEQVEPAYIECGNGAAAMQVSQVGPSSNKFT